MQSSEMPTENDDWKRRSKSKRGKKVFCVEYRMREQTGKSIFRSFTKWYEWSKYWSKYKTEKQREEAVRAMNRKDTLFEYRIPSSVKKLDEEK